jgi:hypothetical protein
MDSFENLISGIFSKQGFWVKQGFKVNLTKNDKKLISRPSSPRWEIDLVAYKPKNNELFVIECKSYLDSHGVSSNSFGIGTQSKDHYKLFNDNNLRKVVFRRLKKEMLKSGLCREGLKIKFCLVAGKIRSKFDLENLKTLFNKNKWLLFDDAWIRKELLRVSELGYEDDVGTITAKLLLRK